MTLEQGAQSTARLLPISVSQLKGILVGFYNGSNTIRDRVKPFACNDNTREALGDYNFTVGGL